MSRRALMVPCFHTKKNAASLAKCCASRHDLANESKTKQNEEHTIIQNTTAWRMQSHSSGLTGYASGCVVISVHSNMHVMDVREVRRARRHRHCAVPRLEVTQHGLGTVLGAPVAVEHVTRPITARRSHQTRRSPVHQRGEPACQPSRVRHHVNARPSQRQHVTDEKKQGVWHAVRGRGAENNSTATLDTLYIGGVQLADRVHRVSSALQRRDNRRRQRRGSRGYGHSDICAIAAVDGEKRIYGRSNRRSAFRRTSPALHLLLIVVERDRQVSRRRIERESARLL